MKTEQINVAIAELLGWSKIENHHTMMLNGFYKGYPPKRQIIGKLEPIPLFTEDLNACYEMEKTLSPDEGFKYQEILEDIAQREIEGDYWLCFMFCHASAIQRCEAFLKFHGKWLD